MIFGLGLWLDRRPGMELKIGWDQVCFKGFIHIRYHVNVSEAFYEIIRLN